MDQPPQAFGRVEGRRFLGDSMLCEVREVQINTVSLGTEQGACIFASMGLLGHGCSWVPQCS